MRAIVFLNYYCFTKASTLALFVALVGADDADNPAATHNLAVLTKFFY